MYGLICAKAHGLTYDQGESAVMCFCIMSDINAELKEHFGQLQHLTKYYKRQKQP